jgi:phenylpropionate dioxygenase-like ring-hydroxylating dioxygenase large terminal subunit
MPDDASKPAGKTRAAPMKFGEGWLRDCWYYACEAGDLKPGKLQRFELLGEPVLLGRRRDGAVYAIRDICPHRAAPLSAGKLVPEAGGGESVECPYHGWRFGTDGVCKAIPFLPDEQEMDISRIRVKRYPAAESQGMVFVWFASDARAGLGIDAEPDAPPPVFPGALGRPAIVDHMDFDTHMDHAIVGLMDPTHAPYVHAAWWARSARRMKPKDKLFEPSPEGFVMTRHATSKANRIYAILGGQPQTEITFRLPGYRWEHIQVGRFQLLALTCLTPVNETKTRLTQLIWSDHPAMMLRWLIKPFARAFIHQDGDMVNLQNMGLKYDPSLLWIDDADTQAKWYQQLKREWAASRAEGRPFENPVKPVTLRWIS